MTARRLTAAELPAPLGPRIASRHLDMQAEVGMWVSRCWNTGLAHGCELVGRHMPAGWFPADADDVLRDLEGLGFIERATELPTPTPEQAFFGTAGVDVKKCSKPGMRHHLQRSWWGWRPVRSCAAYAAWIEGGPMPGPGPAPSAVALGTGGAT